MHNPPSLKKTNLVKKLDSALYDMNISVFSLLLNYFLNIYFNFPCTAG